MAEAFQEQHAAQPLSGHDTLSKSKSTASTQAGPAAVSSPVPLFFRMRTTDNRVRSGKLRMVQCVERLGAELEERAFTHRSERELLEERQRRRSRTRDARCWDRTRCITDCKWCRGHSVLRIREVLIKPV